MRIYGRTHYRQGGAANANLCIIKYIGIYLKIVISTLDQPLREGRKGARKSRLCVRPVDFSGN
jgi:hypothetical protein